MGQHLLRKVLSDIHDAGIFAVLADETRDITNQEQLAICIRWVDAKFDIHEDLIGLVQLDTTTADSITKAMKDIFTHCSLPIGQCKGQGYDGASTMMGYLSGVATQLRKEEPTVIPVHCFAHCLNLCLQEAAKVCTIVRDSLGLIGEISQLINYSPKCSFIFSKCKDELCPHTKDLKPL